MTPTKSGQIVHFHTPLEGEDINQKYVLLEINTEVNPARAKIKALNTGLPFAPINVVALSDLELIETATDDLIGNVVFITKTDDSKVLGKIISVEQPYILPKLTATQSGVETNVNVTVVDKEGVHHQGTLFVS